MGTRDTVKTATFISAFLCLAVWNAVLQTNYESILKEVERNVQVHDGNLEKVESQLERYFEHLEGKLETHDSNFEQVHGKLENHNRKLMEHRNLMKSIDEAASRRIKRSLDTQPQITGGATYIRWGRTVCPNDAELVYADHPKYANYGSGHVAAAHIHGVELKITGMSKVLFETTNARFSPLDNSDVQCAVCRSRSNPSMVMIPGTIDCSDGWKMEYWGYLMTGQWDQTAQHNHAPEAGTDGGTRTAGGAVMYHVLGECGSLPCKPYVQGYELTLTASFAQNEPSSWA